MARAVRGVAALAAELRGQHRRVAVRRAAAQSGRQPHPALQGARADSDEAGVDSEALHGGSDTHSDTNSDSHSDTHSDSFRHQLRHTPTHTPTPTPTHTPTPTSDTNSDTNSTPTPIPTPIPTAGTNFRDQTLLASVHCRKARLVSGGTQTLQMSEGTQTLSASGGTQTLHMSEGTQLRWFRKGPKLAAGIGRDTSSANVGMDKTLLVSEGAQALCRCREGAVDVALCGAAGQRRTACLHSEHL